MRQTGRGPVVGLDLGTSHCAAAWAEPLEAPPELHQVQIPQRVALEREDCLPLLPSVLYRPTAEEAAALKAPDWVAGVWARRRGQETRGRAVHSAKSWLSHAAVDRLSGLLPWVSERAADVSPLSPVEVSARLLRKLVAASRQALGDREAPATWVLTVPASFDEGARELTRRAAEQAKLSVHLLEEPQAALYDCLPAARGRLETLCAERGGAQVLVCDIGGGTSDFSLLSVNLVQGSLRLCRTAVGRHLLLGGDNMDWALARQLEQRLGSGLPTAELSQLLLACREVKEQLLGGSVSTSASASAPGHVFDRALGSVPDSARVRLAAGGSRLLGRVRTLEVTRQQVHDLVLDGFFPEVDAGARPQRRRSALAAMGLPYERDAAITRHLASFLTSHGAQPDAVLFNGGVTRAPSVRARVLGCLERWGKAAEALADAHPDLAVSRGAVRYGLSLQGVGLRIESGAASAFYVGVGGADAPRALCVVPRGAPVGAVQHAGRALELEVGGPVRFDAYASQVRDDQPGVLIDPERAQLDPLPSLQADLTSLGPGQVPVELSGWLGERGRLALQCQPVSASGGATSNAPSASALAAAGEPVSLRWSLGPSSATQAAREAPGVESPESEPRVKAQRLPSAMLPGESDSQGLPEPALELLEAVFVGDAAERAVKDLVRNLEKHLGPRKLWDASRCRVLADALLARHKGRQRDPIRERHYWMLLGFCLRPGFGWPGDADRVKQAFRGFSSGPRHRDTARLFEQFWIAWRRLAAGLGEPEQSRIHERIAPVLAPDSARLKRPKGFRLQRSEETWRLAAHLEWTPAGARAELGRWVLERSWHDREPALWTHLARIGARELLYAPATQVLEAALVERWVEQLLSERWDEVPTACAAAVQLARCTGDSQRDLDPRVRQEVASALRAAGADEVEALRVLAPPERDGAARTEPGPAALVERFDEALPLGLRLSERP